MEWLNSTGKLSTDRLAASEEVDDSDEENLYNFKGQAGFQGSREVRQMDRLHETGPATSNPPQSSMPRESAGAIAERLKRNAKEHVKVENEKKAAALRAKLLANRQNTPSKVDSRSATLAQALQGQSSGQGINKQTASALTDPSNDIFGLEALLADGKAAADATKEQSTSTAVAQTDEGPNGQLAQRSQDKAEPVPLEKAATTSDGSNHANQPAQPTRTTQLSNTYYDDLSVWLELTGYHDVEYRTSKLSTHKERKALESEAARIAERLAKLEQVEQEEIVSLRSTIAKSTPLNQRPPPPLPAIMPSIRSTAAQPETPSYKPRISLPHTNGTKRAHSPELPYSDKAARPRLDTLTNSLERRISYPDIRREVRNDSYRPESRGIASRDPSLERRQRFYKLEGNTEGYDRRNSGYENRGRLDYGNENVPYRGHPQQRRGSGGANARRGG